MNFSAGKLPGDLLEWDSENRRAVLRHDPPAARERLLPPGENELRYKRRDASWRLGFVPKRLFPFLARDAQFGTLTRARRRLERFAPRGELPRDGVVHELDRAVQRGAA